jgi:uncharacterized protein (DUF58 family)
MKVSEGFNGELVRRLDRLRLKYSKRMGGVSGGVRRSAEKGSSNEFSDFRSYTEGDSLRYVDWNSYARLGKLFVKLYMEEKQTEVNIVADCSASMGFDNKDYVSGLLATCVCYAAVSGGDRARLYMGEERLAFSSKSELGTLLSFADNAKYDGSFSVEDAVRRVRLSDRGRFVLISDFMYPTEELEGAVKYLTYKKQEATLVYLTSERESALTEDGELTLVDSESGAEMNIEITDAALSAYENALKEHKGRISEICRKYGVGFTEIKTEDNFSKILVKILC